MVRSFLSNVWRKLIRLKALTQNIIFSEIWSDVQHPTKSRHFLWSMNIKHTIYFGYLTPTRQETEKRLMDFLFNTPKTSHGKVIIWKIGECICQCNLLWTKCKCICCMECSRQIIICHDYVKLPMWEISPIILLILTSQ